MDDTAKVLFGQMITMCGIYLIGKMLQATKILPKTFNRAWILTLYSRYLLSHAHTLQHSLTYSNTTHSLLTSVAGIVMFKDVCELGFTEVLESQETEMSRYLATMFLAYCVMDLAIANVEYVNELDWESGGLHHVAYAVFCSYLLYYKQTMFFSVFLVEEIPTIYLSWKRIRGEKELKWTFATMFYLTRILYHSVATYALLEQSTICFAAGLVVLRQHMQWFGRWWTSQGMKLKQAQLTLKQKLAKELEEIESLKKKCSVVTQQDKENSTELTRVLDTISKIPVV